MSRSAVLVLILLPACASRPAEPPPRFWFDFIFFQTAFDSEPESAVAVNVAVAKEDPVAGLVWWRGLHVEKDRIGWCYEKNAWTSLHWVWSERLQRECEVDFDSGAVIQAIRGHIEAKYQYEVCQIGPGFEGRMVCNGPEVNTYSLRVNEVRFLDEQKKLHVVRVPRDHKPWWNDLCVKHGGLRPLQATSRVAPGSGDIEVMAAGLLAGANYDWASRNPLVRIQAQVSYRRLLRDFARDPVVDKHRSMILERAIALVEH